MARMKLQTVITDTQKGHNSKSGNPSIVVLTQHGEFRTAVDSAVAHGIGNSEYRGVEVVLTLDGNRIVGVATLDGEHATGAQE